MEGLKRKGIAAFVLSALVALVIGGGLAFNPGLATAADTGTITVSKVDETGAALQGAQLQLLNSQGSVVKEWTSGTTAESIGGLADGAYTVHEVSAPDGYTVAPDISVNLKQFYTPASPISGSDIIRGTNTNYSQGIMLGSHVVYCLDRYSYTTQGTVLDRMQTTTLDQAGATLDNGSASNIDANKDKILAALLVGYPNNAVGLQEELGLNDTDFHRLTQDTIWYYANGITPGSSDNSWADADAHRDPNFAKYWAAFQDAVEKIDTSNFDAKDIKIYYRPEDTRKYQPVIDAGLGEFYPASVPVKMTDAKGESVKVEVEKTWQDTAASDIADTEVTFNLYYKPLADGDPTADAPGTLLQTKKVTAADAWKAEFTGLPATQNGQPVKYFVLEDTSSLPADVELVSSTAVADAQSSATIETGSAAGASAGGAVVSNSWEPTTPNIGGENVIASGAVPSDQFTGLDANGNPSGITLGTMYAAGAGNDLKFAPGDFSNPTDDMKWVFEPTTDNKFRIKSAANGQYLALTRLEGTSTQIWGQGNSNSSIEFYLNDRGDGTYNILTDYSFYGNKTTFVLTFDANGKVYGKNAANVNLSAPDAVVQFTKAIAGSSDGSDAGFGDNSASGAVPASYKYTFTNKKTTSNNETVDVSGTKTWDDEDDKDKLRPAEIEVQLLADDKAVDGKTAKATAAGGWAYSFTGLPKFAADGKTEIVYSVKETTVPDGYTANVDGMYITNTHTPETVEYKGSLQTTVKGSVGGAAAVLYAGEDGTLTTDVVDTITYSGLQKGATYTVTGTLMENGTKEVANTTKDFKAEGASGTWEITFSNVTLEVGKSYVVFEEAVNKEVPEDTAEHKNPDDQAQTVIVEKKPEAGDLATTVEGASDSSAASLSAEDAAAKTSLTDKIDYKNLTPGATYTVSGRLMEDGTDEVAVATEELKASDTGSGTWEITFTFDAGTLKPDTKYVVFESATNKDDNTEEVHEHANPNDVSQTVVVKAEEAPVVEQGSIGTTVEGASDSSAANLSAEDAAAKTSLVDVIDYENLVPGATYTVSGRLMENGATEVASATAQCVASDTGSGSWEITFEFPAGTLKPDTKYVVFEKAESPDDANGPYNHADATDVSQTIVVEEKEPSNSGNGNNGDNGDNGETGNGETGNGETGNGETGNGNTGGGENSTSSEESGTGSGDNANSSDNTNSGDNKNGGSEEGDDATAGRTVQTPSTVTARNLSATPTTSTSRSASTTPTTATTTTARSGARTGDGMDGVVALLSMAMAVSVGAMAYTRKRRSEQE